MKRKRIRKLLIVLAAVLVVLAGAFIGYTADYYHAGSTASDILTESENNLTRQDGFITLGDSSSATGLIFYPGGKVEYTAYLPLLSRLSEHGIFCVLVKMPFNLAVFDINAAEGIIGKFPSVGSWLIGGHSLGGAMAADFAARHNDEITGLVLLAAYPATSLKDCDFPVLTVYGSEDGVLNRDKLTEGLALMPPVHTEIVLKGGNHAQFGDYGDQAGDGAPQITPDEQIIATADAILQLIA